MTMDIQASKVQKSDEKSKKRPFDVAFLMLPDDKRHKRRCEFERHEALSVRSDLQKPRLNNNESPSKNAYSPDISVDDDRNSPFLLTKIFEDPLLSQSSEPPRSAFSKVSSATPTHSPVPPLSPGQLSCPSASPPMSNSPPSATYYPPFGSAFQAKRRELQAYSAPPFFPSVHMMPQPEMLMRNTATAAILTSLLPTTMSPFSLTAQNICAKCNISFRMTSDLVYHMRSHHKNDHVQDPLRRKREEKLRCSVCSETFRERHHLTRHMTAHQDKEGDLLDGESLMNLHKHRRAQN